MNRGPVTWTAAAMVIAGCGRAADRPPQAELATSAPAAPAAPDSCVRDVGQVTAVTADRAGGVHRPVHTYSIVARDPATGDLGVAVQSHWFAVGNVVSWAEPGVGAIATQSFADPEYGRRGLARMRAGEPAGDALRALIADDDGRDVRQVAFVDAAGAVAAHTGAGCIDHAGHHVGAGFSVQANIMANDRVVPAMATAFERAGGDLAERLVVALEAAQEAGGDLRGCQSASLLVVAGEASAKPSHDTRVDLRVDDAADPLRELRRLLAKHRVYAHMNAGDVAVERKDLAAAREHYAAAAAGAPGDLEVRYWQAVTLAATGDVDAALPIFHEVFAGDRRWVELTRRLQKPGLVPATPDGDALIDRILREAPR
jgi:uncharacterized Ntn-hydrolase superfamily protein